MRPGIQHFAPLVKALPFLLWLCLQSSLLVAQKNTTLFKYYTTGDGLSQNMVHCIHKDSKGFMWFGTWSGLNRFDGYEFTVFKRDATKRSLSGNFIYALGEDHFGNVWIGTDNGLNIYLYEQDRVVLLESQTRNNEGLISSRINAVMRDSNNDIWIGTDEGLDVVSVLNEQGEVKLQARYVGGSAEGQLPGNYINTIYQDREGRIWVGSNSGLHLFDPATRTFTTYRSDSDDPNSLSNDIVHAIYQDENGRLWVGTYYGLNLMDTESAGFDSYLHDPADASTIAHNVVRDIKEDLNGRLTIATLGGVSVHRAASDDFESFRHEHGSHYGLNNEFVSCLFPDEEGNVWIGTEKGGVNWYNVTQKRFSYFEKGSGGTEGLNHNTINAVFEESDFLWVGTAGGGLNRYDKTKGTFRHYTFNQNNPSSLNNNFVSAILGASDGHLYVGTWGGGLHRLKKEHTEAGVFEHFPVGAGVGGALPDNFVSSLAEDDYDNLWIGTGEGLSRMNLRTGDIEVFPRLVNNRPIASVGCIQFDQSGNLWAGTSAGLYKIKAHKGRQVHLQESEVRFFVNDPDDPHSLPGNFVISIHLDASHNLWVGTYGNGLARLAQNPWYPDQAYFVNYTEADGLSNNVVFGILEDDYGNLWLTTDYGLSRFNKETEAFKNYYYSDGLRNNQYYWSATYKNQEGMLYVGGMNGLNFFFPDSLSERIIQPNIAFTDLRLNNRSVEPGRKYNERVLLDKALLFQNDIVLPYSIREFSLFFSALLFDQPNKIQYAYKLEGFDDQWTYVDASRRFASFMNLPGGNYTLLVKATDSENNWGPDHASINIRIIPPFYASWWFITSLILAIIGAIIAYNRYKLFIIRLQKKKLEEKVKWRTSQILAQKEILQAQAEHLKDSLGQLEKRKLQVEEQKFQLEYKNDKIQAQRDKLIELHKKLHASNQQQLSFFTNISHEFRTPLTLILSPLGQLLKNEDINRNLEVKNNLELIQKNAGRLLRLINQLMDVRKIESGKTQLRCSKGDIVAFCRDIFQSFTPLAEKQQVQFTFYASHPEIFTLFDREKIENIMFNLLSNGFKYTPSHGKLEVYVSRQEHIAPPGKDEIAVVEQAGSRFANGHKLVEIVVRDNGIGMDPAMVREIFQKFSRLQTPYNNTVKGSGIGLFLTRELIRIHRGSLFVETEPNKGSSFRVQLPSGEGCFSRDEILERDSQMAPGGNIQLFQNVFPPAPGAKSDPMPQHIDRFAKCSPRVLVIEDDAEMREFITDNLGKSYKVISASNGREGLEMAIAHSPDLVLSDIMMPEMDGLELCHQLKSDIKTSHIPVILLTARSDDHSFVEGLETGADDYVSKPFNLDVLEAKIRSTVENRKRLKKVFRTSLDPIPKGLATNSQDMGFLQKAVKLIEDNLSSHELNVKMLADELCMSRSLLHKKLTAIAGQSTNDFITSIRLKKSAAMLQEGMGNITEVAYDVGFNDPKYFSRCFKKHFNLSPTEFLNGQTASESLHSPFFGWEN